MTHPDSLAEAMASTPEMREAICLAALGLGGVIPADRSADYAISAVAMLLDHSASQAEPSGWVATALRAFLIEVAHGDLMDAAAASFDELAASIGPACEHLAAAHSDEEAVAGFTSMKEIVSILRAPADVLNSQRALEACEAHLNEIAIAANTLDTLNRRQRLTQRTTAGHYAPQTLQGANHAA